MKRQWEIDALRGLMLVLMTLTHLPTRLTDPFGQPFGFVSAAEGFVLLSAYMAGMVYSRLAWKDSIDAMQRAFYKRALKVYMSQAATLLFLFTVITAVGLRIDQPAVKDLASYYLTQPHAAFLAGLFLLYEPPLLDILPMYVLFMLASPWVLSHALRRGWMGVMTVSALLWALSQFGLSGWVYEAAVAITGLPVPFNEMGSFNTFSWQLLWAVGLWMGASRNEPGARPFTVPNWVLLLAAVIALYGFYWRHEGINGQAPFGGDEHLNLLFDKWQLGPLRLLDLTALGVLTIRFGPALARWLPRQRWLETMGSASLAVFCAHLVAVLLVLAFFGGNQLARPWWGDGLLLLGVFAALYGVARATLWLDRSDKPRPAAAQSPGDAAP
ncbi:MAG: OpgC domain-containing protein [Comamonadaceae bacterium]|nr:MAG: OpgC domain-containing protein [Comamonadaceae bacterium]